MGCMGWGRNETGWYRRLLDIWPRLMIQDHMVLDHMLQDHVVLDH